MHSALSRNGITKLLLSVSLAIAVAPVELLVAAPFQKQLSNRPKKTLPLPCDTSDVKGSLYYCSPEKEVVSKGYVNLTGTSDQEFLVMYRYHTIEGLPSEAYLTLFRQSNGKVVPVNTSKVFEASE